MSFELPVNNLLGAAVQTAPANAIATAANFIDPYDYAMQYKPELIPQFHLRYGKGSILGFTRMTGSTGTYAADSIKHGEQNRLHTISKNVAVSGTTFTCPQPHQLRVKEVITISDGTNEDQAIVTNVISSTVFTALSDTAASFAFAGNVTISSTSNRFAKGEDNFTQSMRWTPTFYENYTHIIKDYYDINNSDRAQDMWLETPNGSMWFNEELAYSMRAYDNKCELTHIFHRRAAAGSASVTAGYARGMKGVIQQTEERGNVGNEYIETIDDLSLIAYRIKQQGGCSVYTIWADHQQMYYFNQMLAGVNAGFVNGSNYGIFNNSKEMALALDFSSVSLLGVTFHICPLRVLDDTQFFGTEHFTATAPACLLVPAGNKPVWENDMETTRPYLTIRTRKSKNVNRDKHMDLFGPGFTPHKKDTMECHLTSEQTNQLVGANEYFVVRRNDYYA